MRADLHVHSYHSGYAKYLRRLHARDCYSSPMDVYRVAKARGMDLVCLTDHDSIDGSLEFLDAHPDAPDFIIGEEIECVFPDVPDLRVHLGAIGLTERIHADVQRLRSNVFDVARYLKERQVLFAFNHPFLFFRDQMPVRRYIEYVLELAPAIETHNGAMLDAHNQLARELWAESRERGKLLSCTGGSDAHTLRTVGTAYTEAPGATREEFLANLRAGNARVGGRHGGRGRLTAEIYGVIWNYWRALFGFERHDLDAATRLAAGACALGLAPFQFIPAVLALTRKADEARRVRRCRESWAARSASGDGALGPLAVDRS